MSALTPRRMEITSRTARVCLLAAIICSFCAAGVLHLFSQSSAGNVSAQPIVDRMVMDDTVQPISAEILARAIGRAQADHAAILLIELNTPGGLLDSTREMVRQIGGSSVPVVIYVAPSGARAASAGFFLLQAADVAAMAPGTNTGAAHPVLEGAVLDPIMKEKMENDAAAFLRSYAGRRGRDPSAAETAVRQSKAFSDTEALDLHLVDVVAKDDADLLRQLDGRTITRFDGSQQTLHLANSRIVTLPPTIRENILDHLMQPNLALLILVLGGLLIYLEFHIPGTVVPGALGALLVLLAMFALNLLPIHYTSAGLLLCGLLLIFAEAKFPSHGLLSIAGTCAIVFGMLTLVDGPVPELRVGLTMALAAGIAFGGITFVLAALALKAKRSKSKVGMDALLGQIAEVRTPLAPEGQVLVRGELWNAICADHAAKGDSVIVRGYRALTLEVERK
jgi:membrane-bound serine protease (ClpP class)